MRSSRIRWDFFFIRMWYIRDVKSFRKQRCDSLSLTMSSYGFFSAFLKEMNRIRRDSRIRHSFVELSFFIMKVRTLVRYRKKKISRGIPVSFSTSCCSRLMFMKSRSRSSRNFPIRELKSPILNDLNIDGLTTKSFLSSFQFSRKRSTADIIFSIFLFDFSSSTW